MNKYYKIAISFLVVACVCTTFIVVIIKNINQDNIVPKMEISIPNLAVNQDENNHYSVDFAKIKMVSFATSRDELFVRFDLGAKLPKSTKKLPHYNGNDQLKSLYFYIDFRTNYFGNDGKINPGQPDVTLDISFYGDDQKVKNNNKINVDGQLVSGGPDHDYFVVKYPYDEVMFNQAKSEMVFWASSISSSEAFGLNASYYTLKNSEFAATTEHSDAIKINLAPKYTD
ncbi:MAG: hypothetical protein WCO23_03070 [bacterium]